ncbi:MAG: lysozyme inhibitor LprI family protein [Neisseria sp.]|nr:lysozyme inhibitor LprI family protein [Neisseria sp.]
MAACLLLEIDDETGCFLTLLGLAALPAHAVVKDCWHEGGSSWRCFKDQRKEFAKKLAKIEPRIRRQDAYMADRFKVSQRLWLKFVEADCRYETEFAALSIGTSYVHFYEKCMAERYDQRLNDVEDMIKFLTKLNEHDKEIK